MTDALKQSMIECLKIYVRTELARSIEHPSLNKICARWSNGAFMSIQTKYKINIMNALMDDDYLKKYTLEELWRNSFYNHNCDGTSFIYHLIYHYCNDPWTHRPQHPFIKYTSAIELVKDKITKRYTNKVVHTLTLTLQKLRINYFYEGDEKYAYQIEYPTTKEYIVEIPIKFTDNCLNVDGFKKAYEKIEEQLQKNNELIQKFARLRKLYEIKHICKE